MRVRVSPTHFVYPDLLVVCGNPSLTDESVDTLTNPKVVFGVLSPSTADYDRGGKFELYRELPSFEEYVLVSQDRQRVETFSRTQAGDWLLKRYDGPAASLALSSLGIPIPLAEIYSGIL
jgi:Uma2 family endonuclease